MKIKLDQSGVDAIRQFAEAMPVAIKSIISDTENLVNQYRSVSMQIGVHEADFANMMRIVSAAQQEAAEAISALIPKLNECADSMQDWINTHPELVGKK